jgi:hypothetical protein
MEKIGKRLTLVTQNGDIYTKPCHKYSIRFVEIYLCSKKIKIKSTKCRTPNIKERELKFKSYQTRIFVNVSLV